MSEIANRVKEVREVINFDKNKEIANLLGVSEVTYSNYETGKRTPKKVLFRYKSLFNIDPNWIMTGEGQMFLDGGASKGTYFNNQPLDQGKNITTQDNNQELQLLKKLEIDNNFDDELLEILIQKSKQLSNKNKKIAYHKIGAIIEELL
jgi:transcriptional regulator with XRE-family HTH domain